MRAALLCISLAVCGFQLAAGHTRAPFEFALKFNCTPSPTGVNHAWAVTQSLITNLTSVPPRFVEIDEKEGHAEWVSVLVNQTANSWSEKGNISFTPKRRAEASLLHKVRDDAVGNGEEEDMLHFESPGLTGVIFGNNHGAITYNITGGTGRFRGATGMMVDTFVALPNQTTFAINAWGFFWLPGM